MRKETRPWRTRFPTTHYMPSKRWSTATRAAPRRKRSYAPLQSRFLSGGKAGHWKWRDTSFPRGCWKSFPTDLLEMEEIQGSCHFHISKAISVDMKAGRAVGRRERLVGVLSQVQMRRLPKSLSWSSQPCCLGIGCRIDHPQQGSRSGACQRIQGCSVRARALHVLGSTIGRSGPAYPS